MEPMSYKGYTEDQLRTMVRCSTLFEERELDIVKAMDRTGLIEKLEYYHSVIIRSGYIYGSLSDMVRMCLIKGFNLDTVPVNRFRAMLRNGKEDSAYVTLIDVRVYVPFTTNDSAPVITLPSLDYQFYYPEILSNYIRSSALYEPEHGELKSVRHMVAILRRYDNAIEQSNYELGNDSDIMRICENKAMDCNQSVSDLRALLVERGRIDMTKHSNPSSDKKND